LPWTPSIKTDSFQRSGS